VCPLRGISSSRRRARARLEVGGNATAASASPPLKATRDTLSPRLVASSSNSNTTPFTFSTIRSACTDQLLSTTKQTLNGERCSRIFRRRSSDRISTGTLRPRTVAAPSGPNERARPGRSGGGARTRWTGRPARSRLPARRPASSRPRALARPPLDFFSGHLDLERVVEETAEHVRLGSGGRAERIGLEAVTESESGRLEHVLGLDQIAAGQRSDRLRALDNGDIGPMAADAGADHEPPHGAVEGVGDADRREARLPGCDRLGQLGLRRSPLLPEALRVRDERLARSEER